VVDPDLLIGRCQAGDDGAFDELYRVHRNDVARLVQRLLGRTTDVEDVTQEVFLQVHRSLKDFRYGSRFSTWLYRVTVNVVLMQRRAQRSRPALVVGLAEGPVDGPESLPAEDAHPLPDEQIAQRRRVRALLRILESLSEKKRTTYVLHDLEGMLPADIARKVGAPVLTVRTRLFYARREIVGRMSEEPSLRALTAWIERGSQPQEARSQKTTA
jgi:RNA polymerase sigma-70 factor (ECF subfamily)